MIRQAFQHFRGIGAGRLRQLQEAGIRDWDELAAFTPMLPLGDRGRMRLREEIAQCERAIAEKNLRYLVGAFRGCDQWRILAHFFPSASYFDIETSGLDIDSHVTVVTCYHRDRVYSFVHGENMEAFLDLLEDVELLVSFNGASFDIPQILRMYHIPDLPCAHIDLRWLCYHASMHGGLKSIEKRLDINRPRDLIGVDGDEAVWLWQLWENQGMEKARERLLRYCSADSVSLKLLSAKLLSLNDVHVECPTAGELWSLLGKMETPSLGLPATETPNLEAQDTANGPMKKRMIRHLRMMRNRR